MTAGWRSEARARREAAEEAYRQADTYLGLCAISAPPNTAATLKITLTEVLPAIGAVADDLGRALDALDAVLALHPAEDEPSVVEEGFTGPGGTWQEVPVLMCRGCWDPHPCPTVRAIEGTEDA